MNDVTDVLGLLLIAVGVFVAIKAAKTVARVLMVLVVAAGLYLWFGVQAGG
jgi:hypothetical protein